MAKNLTKAQERLLKQKQEEQKLNDQLISDAEELVDLGGKLTDIQQKHISGLKADKALRTEIKEASSMSVSLEKKLTKQSQSLNKEKSKTAILGKIQLANLEKDLKNGDITTEQFKSQVAIVEEISSARATSAEIQKTINDLGEDATEEMKKYLTQAKRTAQVQEYSKEVLSEVDSIFGGMGSKIKDFVTNPLTIAAAILTTFNAQQQDIAQQFGAIGVTEFRKELAGASQEFVKLGFSSAEAQSTISDLANNFGLGVSQAAAIADEVADLAVSTATSVSDSATLVGLLTKTQGLTSEQAMNLSKSVVSLADANDVAPNKVLSDIANNTEAFAKFARDGGRNVLRAAVQARKLGIELGTVANAAEGFLDFESSINAELEASIMLGRNLNLQRARELSLAGDLEGLQQEILKNVGSEAEFNQLNTLQRQSLAKALGMNVSQIQKLVSAEKEAVTLSGALSLAASETIIPEKTITATAQVLQTLKATGMELAEKIGPAFNSLVGLVNMFLGALEKTVGVGPGLLAIFAGLKAHTAFMAMNAKKHAAGTILASFAANPIKAALGVAVGTGVVAAAMMNIDSAAQAQEGGITTQEGLVNVHPQEAIVPIETLGGMIADAITPQQPNISIDQLSEAIANAMKPIRDEIAGLRQDEASYFGFGGSAGKDIGRGVASSLLG